jgi:hypothetical protein
MTGLTRVQDDFQAFLLRNSSDIERHVVGSQRVPVGTRLAIYSDAYCSRLIEALESNYPALAKLLGPHDFAALGTAYVRAHDSGFRSIRYYGHELPAFLEDDADYAKVPILAELAHWEWAMTGAFDAADVAPVDVDSVANVAPDRWAQLQFELHPSLRRLALFWNAPQMWNALTSDAEARPQPAVQAEPRHWLLWRADLQTYFRSLPLPEAEALDTARAGGRFGAICVELAAHFSEDETPTRAAAYLKGWIEAGFITGVKQ